MRGRSRFLTLWLVAGFVFFYGPIASMIVFSFNASRLATVWGGFSTKWYVALWGNRQVVDAALLSLQIAAISATIATALGTMAGIALARLRPVPRPAAAGRHGHGALGDARGDHRPVAAAAVRGAGGYASAGRPGAAP